MEAKPQPLFPALCFHFRSSLSRLTAPFLAFVPSFAACIISSFTHFIFLPFPSPSSHYPFRSHIIHLFHSLHSTPLCYPLSSPTFIAAPSRVGTQLWLLLFARSVHVGVFAFIFTPVCARAFTHVYCIWARVGVCISRTHPSGVSSGNKENQLYQSSIHRPSLEPASPR